MRWILCFILCLSSSVALADYITIESESLSRKYRVEIAETVEAHRQGLMHRAQLGEDHGMLFLFDRPARVRFWMRNTHIPLDMIFIRDGRIEQIETRRDTLSDNVTSSRQEVDAVLEVNAGQMEDFGFQVGDRVKLERCDSPCPMN